VSKAFTKDEGESDAPIVVPRRAPLPAGLPNYVTPRGWEALRAELRRLDEAPPAPADDRRARDVSAARRAELEARLASAVVVPAASEPPTTVRFGAQVLVKSPTGARRFQVVGVDEADPAAGRLAFTAPLARALLGAAVGDVVSVRSPGGEETWQVVEIARADAS